jgi:hypothetical protein
VAEAGGEALAVRTHDSRRLLGAALHRLLPAAGHVRSCVSVISFPAPAAPAVSPLLPFRECRVVRAALFRTRRTPYIECIEKPVVSARMSGLLAALRFNQ